MYTIKLDEQQLRALKTFLERTELRGNEAVTFLTVAKAISEAEQEDTEMKSTVLKSSQPGHGHSLAALK